MHRSLSLCGIAAGMLQAPLPAAAQSSITLAGTMDVAVRQVSNGPLGRVSSQVSGSNSTSKLIIRGTEDLGAGWRAGFFLDGTVLADNGAASSLFWDRRATVGISHKGYGELRLGRDWVPTHLVWSGMDPFTTLGIASANTFRAFAPARVLGQAFGTTADAAALSPTLRVSNAVEYFLPELGGVYGALMISAGEGGNAGAGQTRGQGGRLGWTNKALDVAVARFQTRNANAGQSFSDSVWGVAYNFGVLRVSLAQRRFVYATDRLTSSLLGVTVPAGQGVLKLTLVRADQRGASAALSANDASLAGFVYVHALSKRSAVYGHVARVTNKGTATFVIPGGPAVSANASAPNYFGGKRSSAFEFGVKHDF